MNKYFLKQEFLDCEIHTKTFDGTDILVTSKTFNDDFAEMMLHNGQSHLIQVNPRYNENDNTEKKSYVQLSENVISLTSPYQQIEEKPQKKISKKLASKQSVGKQ
jgi:hypothetical protein